MSSDQWYYELDGRQCGPVATDELKFLVKSGTISETTKVREETATDWQLIQNSGVLGSSGRKQRCGVNRFSPAAPFQRWTKPTPAAEPQASNDQTAAGRERVPLLPDYVGDSQSRARSVVTGSLLAVVLLLLVMWFLWPESPMSGMASSGTGDGAANEGTAQSAATEPDSGESSEATPAEAANNAAAGDANLQSSATASADSSESADRAANTAGGTAGDADSKAKDNAGAAASEESDMAAGVESEKSDSADGGVTVGDADGETRFSVSAPGETTFFGIRGAGRRFTYVVDCSGSMQGEPLDRAKQELISSISKLPPHVEFQIIFFDDLAYEMSSEGFLNASKASKESATSFIVGISGGGGTNVKLGMEKSLSQKKKPDTVFLLTDGSFEQDTPDFIKALNNSRKVRINTVAFVSNAGESLLKEIADKNRGDYRFVP